MSEELTIKTNNVPRVVLDSCELNATERAEFDYHDWDKLDRGEDSASFIRFKGVTYDLGEFMTTSGLPDYSPLRQWDGYHNDSFFSGIVVRYVSDESGTDWDRVIMGTFYA